MLDMLWAPLRACCSLIEVLCGNKTPGKASREGVDGVGEWMCFTLKRQPFERRVDIIALRTSSRLSSCFKDVLNTDAGSHGGQAFAFLRVL